MRLLVNRGKRAYTDYMSISLLIAFAAIGVVRAAPDSGDSRPTYIIRSEGEDYAVFWEERQDKGNGWCRVELNAPWLAEPQFENFRESEVTVFRERDRSREQRIKRGWRDAGFTEISPGNYVSTYEVDLAQRARDMAGVTPADDAAPEPPRAANADAAPAPQEIPETNTRGFVAEWGPHAVLIFVALLLVTLVARTLLFSAD